MSKHTCQEEIFQGAGFRFKACGRGAKYEYEGKHYCGTHHPPTVQAKRDAKRDEWMRRLDAERAARERNARAMAEQKRRADCFPALLEALQAWLALDRNFAAASDQHIAELIAEGAASAPIAKAVQMSRAAIAAATAQAGEVSHG